MPYVQATYMTELLWGSSLNCLKYEFDKFIERQSGDVEIVKIVVERCDEQEAGHKYDFLIIYKGYNV